MRQLAVSVVKVSASRWLVARRQKMVQAKAAAWLDKQAVAPLLPLIGAASSAASAAPEALSALERAGTPVDPKAYTPGMTRTEPVAGVKSLDAPQQMMPMDVSNFKPTLAGGYVNPEMTPPGLWTRLNATATTYLRKSPLHRRFVTSTPERMQWEQAVADYNNPDPAAIARRARNNPALMNSMINRQYVDDTHLHNAAQKAVNEGQAAVDRYNSGRYTPPAAATAPAAPSGAAGVPAAPAAGRSYLPRYAAGYRTAPLRGLKQ
jgi:hypothetical protein